MNLEVHMMTLNPCYTSDKWIQPRGVMVHSLGVAQPDPEVIIRQWDRPGAGAAVHAFVHRGGVIQTLPWEKKGGHCYKGPKGSGNLTHIGFEICEPAGHRYNGGTMVGYDAEKNAAYFADVYRNAVELTACLCKKYGLDPLEPGVVISHAEGYRLGIASNHADVGHWWPKHGKNMDTFRADVATEMTKGEIDMTREEIEAMVREAVGKELAERDAVAAQSAQRASPWAAAAWEKAVDQGVFDGSKPGGAMSREMVAVVLDRLDLLGGAV